MSNKPRRPPAKITTRQPRPDDPMFGQVRIAAIRFPIPPSNAMPTRRNNIDNPVLPPAQSFAVVGEMPEAVRLAFEQQQQEREKAKELPPPTDTELERGAR